MGHPKSYLKDTHPELRGEFSVCNEVPFDSLSTATGKKVSWVCPLGHEYEAAPHHRTLHGSRCPFCSGNKVLAGFNDLASNYPELVPQWSAKNTKSPSEVAKFSNKRAWWVCAEGHEWSSVIQTRTQQGNGCPKCRTWSGRKSATLLWETHPQLESEYAPTNPAPFREVGRGSNDPILWRCSKGHEWVVSPHSRSGYDTGCPRCAVKRASKPEDDLSRWLKSLGVSVQRNSRRVIPPRELDIFIPSHDLAIEFNGLYWHDSNHIPSRQHFEKWSAANEHGIQLITIWEDDWHEKPELVKSMLRHKLGLAGRGIGARKTKLIGVKSSAAREFFEKNHIQGFGSGSMYIGLEHEGELVALSSFKKYPDHLELIRYATSRPIVGGHSKILKSVLPLGLPIHTFADHEVSDGNLYASTGWVADKEIPPDYKYVYQHRRQHKFGFRLKRFKADPDLLFEEGMTEAELAVLNKIPRVYDSGKTRYVYSARIE